MTVTDPRIPRPRPGPPTDHQIDRTIAIRRAVAEHLTPHADTHPELLRVIPALTAALLRAIDPPPRAATNLGLSDREVQVIRLIADGHSNEAAAARLGICTLTVKSHLARMCRRLHVTGRAHLVHIAWKAGVLP